MREIEPGLALSFCRREAVTNQVLHPKSDPTCVTGRGENREKGGDSRATSGIPIREDSKRTRLGNLLITDHCHQGFLEIVVPEGVPEIEQTSRLYSLARQQ